MTTLQSRKYVTAQFFASKYEISERTVYRDLRALGEIGVPIDFEANRGYSILQGTIYNDLSTNSPKESTRSLATELLDKIKSTE